jgi:hypothetical protein
MALAMKKLLIILSGIVVMFCLIEVPVSEARRGCCSHHGGVCGCACCDGSGLSDICAPYYPWCNGGSGSSPNYTPVPKSKPKTKASKINHSNKTAKEIEQLRGSMSQTNKKSSGVLNNDKLNVLYTCKELVLLNYPYYQGGAGIPDIEIRPGEIVHYYKFDQNQYTKESGLLVMKGKLLTDYPIPLSDFRCATKKELGTFNKKKAVVKNIIPSPKISFLPEIPRPNLTTIITTPSPAVNEAITKDDITYSLKSFQAFPGDLNIIFKVQLEITNDTDDEAFLDPISFYIMDEKDRKFFFVGYAQERDTITTFNELKRRFPRRNNSSPIFENLIYPPHQPKTKTLMFKISQDKGVYRFFIGDNLLIKKEVL